MDAVKVMVIVKVMAIVNMKRDKYRLQKGQYEAKSRHLNPVISDGTIVGHRGLWDFEESLYETKS